VRFVPLVLGGLMVLVGGTWFLQGIGLFPGSFMTGQSFWALMGGLILAVGVAMCYFSLRRRR
jgi:hypothetical protein